MIAPACQRWRERRSSYRPAGEPIATRLYEVAEIAGDAEAKAFVEAHHYAHSYPAARRRFGLYRGAELVGVAVASQPMRAEVLRPFNPKASAELGRLVLRDDVPANGESWFVARCFELLRREGFEGLVSFSDPVPRASLDGRLVLRGHVGTVYQALNATYEGRATARTLRLLPDGNVFSARAQQKVRARERGWRYAAARLEAFGAEPLGEGDDARAWLALWLPRLTRTLRHGGNHRYLWALDRASRKLLPESNAYPKLGPLPAEARAA